MGKDKTGNEGWMPDKDSCNRCGGTGSFRGKLCPDCVGTGKK